MTDNALFNNASDILRYSRVIAPLIPPFSSAGGLYVGSQSPAKWYLCLREALHAGPDR